MLDALIFDKDGTLFDFASSWGAWTARLVDEVLPAGPARGQIEAALGYVRATNSFRPDSIVIAHTTPEIADFLGHRLPHLSFDQLNAVMNRLAAETDLVPACDLPATFAAMRARGLSLGLATNDTEAPARKHLTRAGVIDLFDFVAGCDSGWGGKPAPGQLLAFCNRLGLDPARVAMVGDSRHDMEAGARAGMKRIAVLTGVATRDDLAPHADIVLDNIGGILGWLDSFTA
jgi:phosphoglycolate phosphatase